MKIYRIIAVLLGLLTIVQFAGAQEQDQYQKWLNKENNKYQQFKDARDREFSDFLKQEWTKFQLHQGLVPDLKPKPVVVPVYTPPETTKAAPEVIDQKVIEKIELPEPLPPPPPEKIEKIEVPQPVPPPPPPERVTEPVPPTKAENLVKISFFGTPLSIDCDKKFNMRLGSDLNQETISQYWVQLSQTDYDKLVKQLVEIKTRLCLNDWGYCVLLHDVGKAMYPGIDNQQTLLVWFLLAKSGYSAKVGYDKSRIYLLLPTDKVLYNTLYFTINEQRYYLVNFASGATELSELYTYDGSYPGAEQLITMEIAQSLNIGDTVIKKNLKFDYNGQSFTLPVEYNRGTVDFFQDYPQTDLEVYFSASASPEATNSLVTALRPILVGRTESDAVNLLLRFTQVAFTYKTDDEQFGREKFLFPDETIYYPASDCEDRSIFFAHMVKMLLGLDVIGLDYPGHIATAVRFSDNIPGDAVTFDGKKYLICDPTYVNADLGICMPQYKNVEPKVILF